MAMIAITTSSSMSVNPFRFTTPTFISCAPTIPQDRKSAQRHQRHTRWLGNTDEDVIDERSRAHGAAPYAPSVVDEKQSLWRCQDAVTIVCRRRDHGITRIL